LFFGLRYLILNVLHLTLLLPLLSSLSLPVASEPPDLRKYTSRFCRNY
jgi:hypothetical protein